MSNTSNFDFCVELGIDSVKEIFHLAFKDETRFPHSVAPVTLVLSGQTVTVATEVFDDDSRPADLSFADDKHIAFSFPFQLTVQAPDAPDPNLTQIVIEASMVIPGELDSWQENGTDVLGVSFFDVTAGDVSVSNLSGLPTIDINAITAAIHSKYTQIQHAYTEGSAQLNIYDGNSDPSLVPTNGATPPDIQVSEQTVSGTTYLQVTVPLWVSATEFGFTYTSFGHVTFNRQIVQTDTTITIGHECRAERSIAEDDRDPRQHGDRTRSGARGSHPANHHGDRPVWNDHGAGVQPGSGSIARGTAGRQLYLIAAVSNL